MLGARGIPAHPELLSKGSGMPFSTRLSGGPRAGCRGGEERPDECGHIEPRTETGTDQEGAGQLRCRNTVAAAAGDRTRTEGQIGTWRRARAAARQNSRNRTQPRYRNGSQAIRKKSTRPSTWVATIVGRHEADGFERLGQPDTILGDRRAEQVRIQPRQAAPAPRVRPPGRAGPPAGVSQQEKVGKVRVRLYEAEFEQLAEQQAIEMHADAVAQVANPRRLRPAVRRERSPSASTCAS